MKVKTTLIMLLAFVAHFGFAQRHALDATNKHWKPSDYVSSITKVEAYEFKLKKNGKVKRDSVFLYRQVYDADANKVFGQNHWVIVTIGYNDKISRGYTYYDFEKFYDNSGRLMRGTETLGGRVSEINEDTKPPVVLAIDSQGRTLREKIYNREIMYEYNDSSYVKTTYYESATESLPIKTIEVYNAKGYVVSECKTYSQNNEQCEYYEYVYDSNTKISKLIFTNCNGKKTFTFFKYNALGLVTEEKDVFEGKTFNLTRYYYN